MVSGACVRANGDVYGVMWDSDVEVRPIAKETNETRGPKKYARKYNYEPNRNKV
jgi:hypothetical protein